MIKPHLDEALFKELFDGGVVVGAALTIGHIYSIYTELLDLTPISSPLLLTTPSLFQTFHESLGDIRGPYPTFDPYCAHIENVPRKLMHNTFFYRAFNFSMAFDKLREH